MVAMALMVTALSVGGKAADAVTILIGEEPIKGVILQYDEEGFTFLPADVSSPAYLPWHQISLSERERIRRIVGLVDEEEHDATPVDKVDGIIVTLRTGLRLKGVLLPERETAGAVYIKTKRTPYFEIKKSAVLTTEEVRLPETEVFTAEELYDRKLAEIKPVTARDHFEMARWCMKMAILFDKARDHLVRCTIIDPLYEARTGDMVAEIEIRLKEGQARRLYEAIRRSVAIGDYDEALKLIDQLQAAYPDLRYTTEATFLKPEIEAKRQKVLRTKLVGAGYRKIDELVRRKVWNQIPDGAQIMVTLVQLKDGDAVKGKLVEETDQLVVLESGDNTYRIARDKVAAMRPVPLRPVKLRDATFTECKEYVTDAEGGISADLVAALSRQFRIGEEEVKEIWNNRSRRTITIDDRTKITSPSARLREAKYGSGTWLREDGTERYSINITESEPNKRTFRVGGRRVTFEETTTKIDVQGVESGQLEQDVDKWWKKRPRETRYQILKAICADAIMDVVKTVRKKCSACGGKGHNTVLNLTGSAFQRTCPKCRGLKYTVRLRYR